MITIPGEPVAWALFALFAVMAVAAALRVVTASDPFISALSLLFNFVALGVLYLMLDQPYVAISQVLVYVGAVIVLFLFVIAYLGGTRELGEDMHRFRSMRPVALVTGLLLAVLIAGIVVAADIPSGVGSPEDTAGGHAFGSVQAIGEVFLTQYLIPFEATSLVLLVAAVGGIVLGITGRARQQRMRRLMQLRSSDDQRRFYAQQEEELKKRRRRQLATTGTAAEPDPEKATTFGSETGRVVEPPRGGGNEEARP